MIHIRTSLPTATLYIFSFYKQPIIKYLDFVLILTRLFWRSCEWQVIDFEPYDTGSNRKKFMIIKKLILQSCSWMYYLLDSSTCSHFTKDFIWEFSSSFGERTEAFSLLLLLLQHVCIPYYIPPFLSLFLPELCIYIVTVVHVLEYIYAIVRPKQSSMYRDHRFLYVEPSSVYLHLYGTIYTVFMPLWCLFRILFYCYISDYPYACEEFWIVALSLHLRYQMIFIFKKYVGLNMNL